MRVGRCGGGGAGCLGCLEDFLRFDIVMWVEKGVWVWAGVAVF